MSPARHAPMTRWTRRPGDAMGRLGRLGARPTSRPPGQAQGPGVGEGGRRRRSRRAASGRRGAAGAPLRAGAGRAGARGPLGRRRVPPRLLIAREAAGCQQLVSVDLRTGARRTVHLPELRPGRRRLAELVPLAGGAVAGVVADDAEWSQASNEIPPEPRVYAWTTGDL
jgi:hypothetical protein